MFGTLFEFSKIIAPERYSYAFAIIIVPILIYILVNILEYLKKIIKFYDRLPPGPWGVPVLGSMLFSLSESPHAWYLEMARRYGEIFSIQLGQNLVVCIGSAKLLRELFNRADSTGRPRTPFHKLLNGLGIVTSEGVLWKRQRQFLHEKFRSLGVKLWANSRFEKYVLMEVEDLKKKLKTSEGTPLDPTLLIGRHIHNVVCQLMMSFRFEDDDPNFITFNNSVHEGMKLYGIIHIGEYLPWYMNLPGKRKKLETLHKQHVIISNFHAKHIEKRRHMRECADYRQTYEPNDLLDYYLDELECNNCSTDFFPAVSPDRQMIQVMNDLFSAGMETSRNTLVWSLVFMLREPEVAEQVRKELLKVVNRGELVTLEHRLHLPYVEAVLFETLRRVSVVPLGTTHVNTEKWVIKGYVIPAGTHIIPLINKINMDPELFPEPEKFIPERFVKDGKLYSPDYFLPFGVGRRICLGEQLARIELFLFFANIMNCYEFYLPDGESIPTLKGNYGITHSAVPYTLIFRDIEPNYSDSDESDEA